VRERGGEVARGERKIARIGVCPMSLGVPDFGANAIMVVETKGR